MFKFTLQKPLLTEYGYLRGHHTFGFQEFKKLLGNFKTNLNVTM